MWRYHRATALPPGRAIQRCRRNVEKSQGDDLGLTSRLQWRNHYKATTLTPPAGPLRGAGGMLRKHQATNLAPPPSTFTVAAGMWIHYNAKTYLSCSGNFSRRSGIGEVVL